MKKLSKIALSNQGNVLNEDEMQKILGGGSYTCYCDNNCEQYEIYDYSSFIEYYCNGRGYCYRNEGYGGC